MDETSLNKYIATEIMGFKSHHSGHRPCRYCGDDDYSTYCSNEPAPDYCSSLDLIHAVEMKVIEKVGIDKYIERLIWATRKTVDEDIRRECDRNEALLWSMRLIATATALQRAMAVKKAWEQT